ncbi:unnamed protein product [Anisakis simplex]|uniref:Homeobox domain-containing protein n=1 Tax=Anisakis simplex TaxID=6269 RepID=A0A0M3K4X0_ANISI|nr:unnamed protein product [Anisakis simplex]
MSCVINLMYRFAFRYYDPTSDGFYYENMGSRGWRRRMPVNAQKRTRMEQEMYATFLRDPSQFACLQPDLYGFLPQVTTANAAAAYYAGPQIKYYDPASDGYYFEMPSVDGWKRRQPNSSSTSSSSSASGSSSSSGATAGVVPTIAAAFLNCLNGTDFPRGAQFLHHHHAAHQQEPQVTSYGAALARGQLPPAYKLADSAVCNQDPFSSGASSMSTLSSLSEGTPTPPPHHRLNTLSSNGRNDSSIFYDDDNNYIDYVAEQCDRALQLDDMTNEDDSECCIDESVHLPSCLFDRPESPETFAAASSCDTDDVENTPPNKESLDLKRPGTLDLNAVSSSSEISDKIEENETNKMADETKSSSKRHELLLNFNADKFIADMAHYGSNVERVLRDLAALKTPVTPATTSTAAAITTPICNLDSPRTPAIYSAYPNWARAPDMATSNVCNDCVIADFNYRWLRDTTNGTYIEDIWSESDASTAYSSTKSKLSIWRDSGLLTAVPCDNN